MSDHEQSVPTDEVRDAGAVAPSPTGPIGPFGSPPPSHLVLAIVSLVFFWPVGIPAVVRAAQVSPRWTDGDTEGALDASARAKRLASIALGSGVVLVVLWLVLLALTAASA